MHKKTNLVRYTKYTFNMNRSSAPDITFVNQQHKAMDC